MTLIDFLAKKPIALVSIIVGSVALVYTIPNVIEYKEISYAINRGDTEFYIERRLENRNPTENMLKSLGKNIAYKVHKEKLAKNHQDFNGDQSGGI